MTKFSDINLREIDENKPFLENSEFKKGIFHFYFFRTSISLLVYHVHLWEFYVIEKTLWSSELCLRFVKHGIVFVLWHLEKEYEKKYKKFLVFWHKIKTKQNLLNIKREIDGQKIKIDKIGFTLSAL